MNKKDLWNLNEEWKVDDHVAGDNHCGQASIADFDVTISGVKKVLFI